MNEPTTKKEILDMIKADDMSIAMYRKVLSDYPGSPYHVQLGMLEEHRETMQWLLTVRDYE